MYQLKKVETKSDWAALIHLPWKIYKHYPCWIPPLKVMIQGLLNQKHPFFKHASMYPLLAYKGTECVGRVIGFIDQNHNSFHEEKTAFFGFFEVIQDQNLVNKMMNHLANWAKSEGMAILRGPMNLNTNYECGLLVEGFSDPPWVMMTYNPPYYPEMIEQWGALKAKDLFAYYIDGQREFSKKLIAVSERFQKKNSITIRSFRMKEFDQDIKHVFNIYNDAWEKNWGFIPIEWDEFQHLSKDLKEILDPELCLIMEIKGQPVGFAVALPDVNQVFKKIPSGNLMPFGIFTLLWNLKGPGRKKTINRCRIMTLGIKKDYHKNGMGSIFYTEYLKRGPALGYLNGEAGWVLEDNKSMNQALEQMCGQRTKVYRIYDRPLLSCEFSV